MPSILGVLLRSAHAWLCAVLLAFAMTAAASPLELDARIGWYPLSSAMSYREDASRALGVDEVARDPYRFQRAQPSAGEINLGYSGSAYWLALPLRPAPDAPRRWLLEFGYSSIDRIEVYDPLGGGYAQQVAGDRQRFAERPYHHRNLVFPLDLEPGAAQTIYIRVTSDGNLTLPAKLWQPDALHARDQAEYTLLALYYGMLIALLAYNLLLFLSTRDRVFLAYVFFAGAMGIAMASHNGLASQFLWPDNPAWGNVALPVGMSAVGVFGVVFTRLFLGTRGAFPRLDRLLLAFGASFVLSALSVGVSYQFSAIFTSMNGLAFAATATSAGVYCHAQGHPGARYFLLAWTMLAVGAATLALRNMGLLPTTPLTAYSMQIGSALEMLLLSFALADRINMLRRQKDVASHDAFEAKQMLVEGLKHSEQALEQRVLDRTRDLERANSQLREKEKELEYRAHHDPLTGLPNRDLFADRLEQAVARARRGGTRVAALLIDLDHFKEVNDTYGHAAGDRLLAHVATHLAECIRECDTIARVGGDEFVIVLEALDDDEAALRVAAQGVQAVRRAVSSSEWGTSTVGASVGIACFPQHADTADELIRRADVAMYEAKAAGRNCWRVSAAAAHEPAQRSVSA